LRFLETIKGIWRKWVLSLVRMDQEGFVAVRLLDVGFWNTWLEIKDCIGVEVEDIANSCGCGQYSGGAKYSVCGGCLRSISASWNTVSMAPSICFRVTCLVKLLAN
jgi:hypothetical protein